MANAKTNAPSSRISSALNRRDRRKLRTREALLAAARYLLEERSIDSITVDEIAAQADVAKGTVYNYFGDKDALVNELANDLRVRIEDEIARVNLGIEDSAERIARALCCVLRFGMRQPRQMLATARMFPRATDPSAPLNRGIREDVISGRTSGRLVTSTLDAPVAVIVGIAMAAANRLMELGPKQADSFAEDIGRILLHGLGLSPASARRVMRSAINSVLRS